MSSPNRSYVHTTSEVKELLGVAIAKARRQGFRFVDLTVFEAQNVLDYINGPLPTVIPEGAWDDERRDPRD